MVGAHNSCVVARSREADESFQPRLHLPSGRSLREGRHEAGVAGGHFILIYTVLGCAADMAATSFSDVTEHAHRA